MVDIVAELLQKVPPETLYHYTTAAGIIGIVRDSEIWATHTQYLNDRREYVHAVELVRTEIAGRLSAETDLNVKAVLEEMAAQVNEGLASINVCVCSFSEDGDSLPQWRAYGGPTAGYAVGFDSTFLRTRGAKQQFSLAPCLYVEEEQREFIANFVDRIVGENLVHRELPRTDDSYGHWRRGGNLVAYLHRIAPVIKDKAFRLEREWRLISRPLMNSQPHFAYRPGQSMVIPYFKLQLSVEPDEVGAKRIRRVVVGPTPNTEQSIRSVSNLLASVNLMNTFTPGGPVLVERSEVPYRSW